MYSELRAQERAKTGVGCIVHNKQKNKIIEWK